MERMAWRSAMKCERGVLCEKGTVAKKAVFFRLIVPKIIVLMGFL
jgi:hypothetical protein